MRILLLLLGLMTFMNGHSQDSFVATYDVYSSFTFKNKVYENNYEAFLKYNNGKTLFIDPANEYNIKADNYSFTISNDLEKAYYNLLESNLLLTGIYKNKKIYAEGAPYYKWKINSERMKMGDYMVQKATTIIAGKNNQDSTKITAWFTQDIPIPSGPSKFVNLPGLIIKLKYHTKMEKTYTLKSIDFKPTEFDEYQKENAIEVTFREYKFKKLIPSNKLK